MWVEKARVPFADAVCFMQNRGILGAINFTKINTTLTNTYKERERTNLLKTGFLSGMEMGGFFMLVWLSACANALKIIQNILLVVF